MARPFAVLDVFTDAVFGGNPLALVADAVGLSTETMQAVAREFNFSETIFLLPPDDPAHDLKARIFTPGMEIPFAGHPNVGLGVWAAEAGQAFGRHFSDTLQVEEGAGLVELALTRDGDARTATLTAPARLTVGPETALSRIAAACGLPVDAVRTQTHAPIMASAGMGFVCAEMISGEALTAATPVADAFDPLGEGALHELLIYVRDGARVEARMFAPPHGIPEDPATGSAAAALVGLLAHLDPSPDLELALDIRQGVAMGRPSRIAAEASKADGAVTRVRVGGQAVITMTGELRV